MTDSFELECKETILMNNGKEYLCQLAITRKGKNEKR